MKRMKLYMYIVLYIDLSNKNLFDASLHVASDWFVILIDENKKSDTWLAKI